MEWVTTVSLLECKINIYVFVKIDLQLYVHVSEYRISGMFFLTICTGKLNKEVHNTINIFLPPVKCTVNYSKKALHRCLTTRLHTFQCCQKNYQLHLHV